MAVWQFKINKDGGVFGRRGVCLQADAGKAYVLYAGVLQRVLHVVFQETCAGREVDGMAESCALFINDKTIAGFQGPSQQFRSEGLLQHEVDAFGECALHVCRVAGDGDYHAGIAPEIDGAEID